MTDRDDAQRLRRWKLVLGSEPVSPSPEESRNDLDGLDVELEGEDINIDRVLRALYDSDRKAGLGSSSPRVNRWLGDIRRYFPSSVVRIMQKDALERLRLREMLLQPETLEAVEADVHLVGTLLSLKNVIPEKTKETARQVVRKVVREIERRIRQSLATAVSGAIHQAARTTRPRPQDIDWDRTIRRNLCHYLPEHQTIVPQRLIGTGRRQSTLRDVILCLDQSGSMATSVVYGGIFGAVLSSLRAVRTRVVVFDTEVVDLSDHLGDPVDLLFGTQLGGGTDINRALGYCQQLLERPAQTILVLVSDLYEGGNAGELLRRVAQIVSSGATVVCLLALSDEGAPAYNDRLAAELAALGVPAFACTPDLFPELMAAAIRRQDLALWAARNDLVVRGAGQDIDETEPESIS